MSLFWVNLEVKVHVDETNYNGNILGKENENLMWKRGKEIM